MGSARKHWPVDNFCSSVDVIKQVERKTEMDKEIVQLLFSDVEPKSLEGEKLCILMKDIAMVAAMDVINDEMALKEMPPTLGILAMVLSVLKVNKDEFAARICAKYLVILSLGSGVDDLQDIYNMLEETSAEIKMKLSQAVK